MIGENQSYRKRTYVLPLSIILLTTAAMPIIQTYYFDDAFTVVKWILIYVTAAVASLILWSTTRTFPTVNRKVGLCCVGLAINHIALIAYHHGSILDVSLLDRLSWLLIVAVACELSRRNVDFYKPLLMAVFIGLCAFLGLVVVSVFQHSIRIVSDPKEFAITFGNINMAAEFVGFSVIGSLILSKNWKGWSSFFAVLVCALGLTYIYFAGCRSVWTGLALAAAISCFPYLRGLNYLKAAFSFLLPVAIIILISVNLASTSDSYLSSKLNLSNLSMRERLHVWNTSLKVLKSEPFGLGPNRFEYAFVPYQMKFGPKVNERETWMSPHNEVLRFLNEDGIVGFAMISLLGSALIVFVIRNLRLYQASEKLMFAGFGGMFVSQSLFQFPFQNAYPFFLSALCVGIALSRIQAFEFSRRYKLVAAAATGAQIVFTACFCLGAYAEANGQYDLKLSTVGCQVSPTNWRVCLNSADLLYEEGRTAEAIEIADQVLRAEPYNFPAIRRLALFKIDSGKIDEGCELLGRYRLIVGNSFFYDANTSVCTHEN